MTGVLRGSRRLTHTGRRRQKPSAQHSRAQRPLEPRELEGAGRTLHRASGGQASSCGWEPLGVGLGGQLEGHTRNPVTARLLAGAGGSWGTGRSWPGCWGHFQSHHRAPPALSRPLQCPCPVRRARLRGVSPSRAGEDGARTPRGPSPERLHLPHVSPQGSESPHLLHRFRYTWIPSNRAATDSDKQSPEASSRGLSPSRGGSARDWQ